MHSHVRKLKRVVKQLIEAEINEAFKGSMYPDDYPIIEYELRQARNRFREICDQLNLDLSCPDA